MRTEHSVNFVRMGVFAVGAGADAMSAPARRLVTAQYGLLIAAVTAFSAACVRVVHLLTRGRERPVRVYAMEAVPESS